MSVCKKHRDLTQAGDSCPFCLRAERDDAIARAERADALLSKLDDARDEQIDALAKRAERAEAWLAALREAASATLLYGSDDGLTTLDYQPIAPGSGPFATLRAALADTTAAAEDYKRRVEAKTLEAAAADVIDESNDLVGARAWDAIYGNGSAEALAYRLRARADEIRGGR